MLNLLPVKSMLTAVAGSAVAILLFLMRTDAFSGSTGHDLWLFSRYVLGAPAAVFSALWLVWRFFGPAQRATFPFVGGHWKGHLRFGPGDAQEFREADLTISQKLLRIDLALETRESVSHSLAVVPKRDPTGTQYHIYYVFENRRKPEFCKPGLPIVYRGVAILRLSLGSQPQLNGEYFTDQPTNGVAEFSLLKSSWM